MFYSNYRNNMPHYDFVQNDYNPMGINSYPRPQNQRMQMANTMPQMPGMDTVFTQRPFIPDTEIPFDIDGDLPALPRMPGMPNGMPGMMQPGMPGMPNGMPGMMQPTMPGMPNGMPGMMQPGMPNGMPQMPSMPSMPGMPQMPGMTPDGNIYPGMPCMPNGMPMTCEMLRDMMRRMNCPMNGEGSEETSMPRPVTPPENGIIPPPQNNSPATQPRTTR